jgi:hypothetical protein
VEVPERVSETRSRRSPDDRLLGPCGRASRTAEIEHLCWRARQVLSAPYRLILVIDPSRIAVFDGSSGARMLDRRIPPRQSEVLPHSYRASDRLILWPADGTGTRRVRALPRRRDWTPIWSPITPVSCVSCVSWGSFLNSAETHEMLHRESGMRYHLPTTTSCGCWPHQLQHLVVLTGSHVNMVCAVPLQRHGESDAGLP